MFVVSRSASFARAFGPASAAGGAAGTCARAEWQCGNGACVPHAALCDGADDCGDYTDESHCSQSSALYTYLYSILKNTTKKIVLNILL